MRYLKYMTKTSLRIAASRGLILLCLAVALSGCLKTRAQLREDNANPSADDSSNHPAAAAGSQPGHVQDVQPQGTYALDEIKSELTQVEGRIEDLERAKKEAGADAQKDQAAKDQRTKLEGRVADLEHAQEQLIQQIQKLQENQTTATLSPEDAVAAGKTAMESGTFDAAIDSFSVALKSAKGKTAEDATFLRGESYFNLKQYKKAIIDYSKIPEKYTKSHYMPKALLRIGESFESLGMSDDAKGFYQELAEKFPKSKEAKQIHSKLK
jgi:TolA-binding protein